MFRSKLDEKTQQQVNSMLLNGHGIMKVSTTSGVPYQNVSYLRKKLVKAGALKPLNKTTRRRKRAERTAQQTITNSPRLSADNKTASFRLKINGASIDVKSVKSIFVSPELVDINY